MYRSASKLLLGILCLLLAPISRAQAPVAPSEGRANGNGEYVLQRGDLIDIRVFNLSDLDTTARIRPDGKISVLLLNEVQAAGLTPGQLGQELMRGYTEHFRNPRLTVIVKEFAGQSVFVGGEVGQPGTVALPGDMSALQALVKAGGLKDSASTEKVLIVRDIDKGTPRVETLNVKDILENSKPDLMLQPSDVLYVPKSYLSVYVGGEVVRPGMIALAGDLSIMAAVVQAGGFRESAKTDSVVLVRNQNNNPVITKVRVDDIFLDAPHTKLQPFDVVFVPKSRIAKMDRFVDQYLRQLSPMIFSFGFSYLFGNKAQSINPIIF